ncbi:uncharacterized protein KQ657_002822 [Scheffersomyces spartinae]|uniref:Major facilitator superfamily (MFS) profile domain-containing protein n=1 Tax=Scheffersomyces spartinae TaxID=45513 RepID=A0A9P7V5T8_9ASCO|nr:uncharacterized protein KQ657_002822 [Scheffersomyces spartinae]KAG7191686.1 hypothetical protein KQ657_002822 [Scheffersomyces spartinae]
MTLRERIKFLLEEFGVYTLMAAGKDVYIIILLRMIRLISFGATLLILALYLKQIRFLESYIGLFMTLTFVGDLTGSFLLSILADIAGRRNVMVLSCGLATLTGVCFIVTDNKIILTIVSVVGILTPSGGEVGPFRSIEQSAIASLMAPHERSDIYTWYTFLGLFCGAIGNQLAGILVQVSQERGNLGVTDSYKVVFCAYTLLSLVSLVMSLFLTNKLEPKKSNKTKPSDEAPLLRETEEEESATPVSKTAGWFPDLTAHALSLVIKLSILFAIDSFASSLASLSWISYYIKKKFDISSSFLGSVFFTTGIISGIMSLLSTSLTKRFGAVATMVFTHLPASVLLSLLPVPSSLNVTLAIMIIRASTQSMDVAPKHVFLAAIVPESERTAVFGWVNLVKTMAQILGPSIVGLLTSKGMQWLAFVVAGTLKVLYDLGMLGTFMAYNRHNEH